MTDKFSFIRYPLFHLDVFVLAGIAASFCLLAIWAGLSPRHWFLRAAALMLALLALLPIQSHQPALMLALALPLVSITVFLMNRRGIGPPATAANLATPVRVRFGLKDLLLGVLLAGLVFYGVAVLMERRADLNWKNALTGAAALWVLAALWYAAVFARRKQIVLLAIAVLTVPIVTAAEFWEWGGWAHILFEAIIHHMDVLYPDPYAPPDFAAEALGGFLMLNAEFCLILVTGLFLARMSSSACDTRPGQSRRTFARALLAALTVLGMAAGTILYWQMAQDSAIQRDVPHERNSYRELLEVARTVQEMNPWPPATLSDMHSDPLKRATADHLDAAYCKGLLAAAQPGHVPEQNLRDHYRSNNLDPDTDAFVALARAWCAEADSLARLKRTDEATAYYLANIALGGVISRGGSHINVAWGTTISEEMGTTGLAGIRQDVSSENARQLIGRLRTLDKSYESAATVAACALAWRRECHAWAGRFACAIAPWANVRLTDFSERLLDGRIRRRDAEVRLMLADLAVRLHQREQERLPADLSELVPRHLPSLPIDPFSGNPLIYRPQGEDFLLYSVGPDGHDDGGRFGTRRAASLESGFDWGLDVIEQQTP